MGGGGHGILPRARCFLHAGQLQQPLHNRHKRRLHGVCAFSPLARIWGLSVFSFLGGIERRNLVRGRRDAFQVVHPLPPRAPFSLSLATSVHAHPHLKTRTPLVLCRMVEYPGPHIVGTLTFLITYAGPLLWAGAFAWVLPHIASGKPQRTQGNVGFAL